MYSGSNVCGTNLVYKISPMDFEKLDLVLLTPLNQNIIGFETRTQ